jgi:hypothetical protein
MSEDRLPRIRFSQSGRDELIAAAMDAEAAIHHPLPDSWPTEPRARRQAIIDWCAEAGSSSGYFDRYNLLPPRDRALLQDGSAIPTVFAGPAYPQAEHRLQIERDILEWLNTKPSLGEVEAMVGELTPEEQSLLNSLQRKLIYIQLFQRWRATPPLATQEALLADMTQEERGLVNDLYSIIPHAQPPFSLLDMYHVVTAAPDKYWSELDHLISIWDPSLPLTADEMYSFERVMSTVQRKLNDLDTDR